MRLLGFLLLLFYTFSSVGQVISNIPIGSWRTHLPTTSISTISILDNKIYAASTISSFKHDISDNSVATISKIDGLSQSNIEVIRFNESTKIGLIGYSNGNIDIINNGILYNFDVIFRSTVAGSKKINNISVYKNVALISCDYGVTIIDLKKYEVVESWLNLRAGGMPNIVYGATLNAAQDSVYLATEYGLMAGAYGRPGINLMDFTNWKVYTNISTSEVRSVGELNGRIYAGINKMGVFVLAGSVWQDIGLTIDTTCWNLVNSKNKLLVCAGKNVYAIQNATTFTKVVHSASLINVHDAAYDATGSLWVGDINKGLVNIEGTTYREVSLNGPYSSNSFNLYYYNNTMLVNSGGYSNVFLNSYNYDGFYEFQNQENWRSYNRYNSNYPDNYFDNVCASYNPKDETLYIGSYGGGMVSFNKPNTFALTNTSNSTLSTNYITSLDTDADGTLWIATYNALQSQGGLFSKPLNGSLTAYFKNSSKVENKKIVQIRNDLVGNKWMRYGGNGLTKGLMVFNETTFPKVERYFQTGNISDNIPGTTINCIDIDKKGVVWIGSDQGIAGFYEPSNARTGAFVIPIYNGFGVLFDKNITCIKTDGGNRKWVGTTEGLWLFNDNFTDALAFFNVENSPLYSNVIVSIEIHALTGEVFIATDKGIIAYRSDATDDNEDLSSAKIFPNPVKPGYMGVVSIEGLQDNIMVKITDMQGKLFYETRSNGGTAIWNLENYAGVKAESGMYLVFATTAKGEEKYVGKVAIIK